MSTAGKLLLALALVLPVGGYVAGSLAASSTEPVPRPPIVLDSAPVEPVTPTAPAASARPEDDRGDDGREDDIEVITPTPGDVDDDQDDRDGDDRHGDDRDEDDRDGDEREDDDDD